MNEVFERRYSRAEAAKFLTDRGYKVAIATLSKYAVVGGGPKYQKFGRKPLYTEAALLEWAKGKTSGPVSHTSEQH